MAAPSADLPPSQPRCRPLRAGAHHRALARVSTTLVSSPPASSMPARFMTKPSSPSSLPIASMRGVVDDNGATAAVAASKETSGEKFVEVVAPTDHTVPARLGDVIGAAAPHSVARARSIGTPTANLHVRRHRHPALVIARGAAAPKRRAAPVASVRAEADQKGTPAKSASVPSLALAAFAAATVATTGFAPAALQRPLRQRLRPHLPRPGRRRGQVEEAGGEMKNPDRRWGPSWTNSSRSARRRRRQPRRAPGNKNRANVTTKTHVRRSSSPRRVSRTSTLDDGVVKVIFITPSTSTPSLFITPSQNTGAGSPHSRGWPVSRTPWTPLTR